MLSEQVKYKEKQKEKQGLDSYDFQIIYMILDHCAGIGTVTKN